MLDSLPTYDQLKFYWLVMQGDTNLPCAMFLLECDAKEWAAQQTENIYAVVRPLNA